MQYNKSNKTREMILISLFAALTAISGYVFIPLPLSPVPVTAQTLVVMLTGNILRPNSSLACMIIYLLLGLIGLPVFAGGGSGIGVLLGPSGGYLLSWPLAALLISYLSSKIKPSFLTIFLINLLGMIIIYGIGVFQLSLITKISLPSAVMAGAIVFIPADLIKAALASTLGMTINKVITNHFS
jgi:biotin transport system substrate-specific component